MLRFAFDFLPLLPIYICMKRRRSRSKSTFACGHPRTPENTRVVSGRGHTWGRCRKCNNNYMRSYMRGRARRRESRVARLEAEVKKLGG
jgi:hypothetical protein